MKLALLWIEPLQLILKWTLTKTFVLHIYYTSKYETFKYEIFNAVALLLYLGIYYITVFLSIFKKMFYVIIFEIQMPRCQ